MSDWSNLEEFRVVRLNAVLSPMSQYERDRFHEHHLRPFEVEANTPSTIIPRVADYDAIFVVSTALPEGVIESLSRCRVISRLGTGTDKIDVAAATPAKPSSTVTSSRLGDRKFAAASLISAARLAAIKRRTPARITCNPGPNCSSI